MKIQDIELTDEHIGDRVTYTPPHAKGDCSHSDAQSGIIVRWNEKFIFVEYGTGTPHATRSENLVWG